LSSCLDRLCSSLQPFLDQLDYLHITMTVSCSA
jgi:hypothetical protein